VRRLVPYRLKASATTTQKRTSSQWNRRHRDDLGRTVTPIRENQNRNRPPAAPARSTAARRKTSHELRCQAAILSEWCDQAVASS
jgi:hypothetical protein